MSSAAPPFGQRMIGATAMVTTRDWCIKSVHACCKIRCQRQKSYVPTEKRPETIRSISSSSSWSGVFALLIIRYAFGILRENKSLLGVEKFRNLDVGRTRSVEDLYVAHSALTGRRFGLCAQHPRPRPALQSLRAMPGVCLRES